MTLLSVKIAGPAGLGIKSGGLLISSFFQRSGLYFTDYSEYPSLVRGGHNTYQATYSSKPVFSVSQKVDIFFSLKPNFWQKHQSEFSEKSKIYKVLPPSDHPNMVCFGILVALVDGDTSLATSLIKKTYPKFVAQNLKTFQVGYKFAQKELGTYKIKTSKQKKDNRQNLDGNQVFARAFHSSGGKFYAAYPMTPSTGALHLLAQNQKKWGITVVHPEDEISAASMAVGASFAGQISAVGTSGGGFALMTETVSFCGIAEIGLLFYLVSRPGPATGLPTWTSQSDLLFSIFSGHGDFPKIVIAPSDQFQTFSLTQIAIKLSQLLQTSVILLSDKHIAESNMSLPLLSTRSPVREKFVTSPPRSYQRYKNSLSGVSLRTIPGTKDGQFLANSYEHDSRGISTEDSKEVVSMTQKRNQKITYALKLIPKPILYRNNGKTLLISWGSPIGAVRQAFQMGLKGYDLLQITSLWPLDPKIKKITDKYQKLICLENNQFGHLNFLLKTIGINSHQFIGKYDGRPFFPEEIYEKLK